jgi:hypothetical protein
MATMGSKSPMTASGGTANGDQVRAPMATPPSFALEETEVHTVAAQPIALTEAQLRAAVNRSTLTLEPSLEPPGVAEAVKGVTASVWVSNVQVSALWSINQNRNSWAAFTGRGWQKFADNSDSAIMAFTTLAAHARVTQSATSYRGEADNRIHELYVW